MARYSSDSEDDRRSRKKRHTSKSRSRQSRSRSLSSRDSYSSSRSKKKAKKSKKKHRKRSRSSDYRKKRSRSRSRSRRRSRSRSRNKRSRSRSRNRRSRSRGQSSVGKLSNLSTSKYRSIPNTKEGSSFLRAGYKTADTQSTRAVDPCAEIPGFQEKTPTEQNEIRMKMALKAAAETTAPLREQGVLTESSGVAAADVERFQHAIADIEGEGFTQQNFTSSRNNPRIKEESKDNQHETAIFGDVASLATIPKAIVYKDTDSILAPIFYEDPEAKWERWVDHVRKYRRKKLEGEAMT